MKKDKIESSSEIVEIVHEFLPSNQKYIIDELGNITKLYPVSIASIALEFLGYQLKHMKLA